MHEERYDHSALSESPHFHDWSDDDLAAFGSGADFWSTKPRRGLPSIVLTDGPHGLRKQASGGDHLGLGASVPATCFPPAVGLAQTWDPQLAQAVGKALGRESQANDVQVLLGPGINIKRSPLGGRNFEYYSEDPTLSGIMGTAWVRGLQSQGVGASVKHFALNNQEHDRMRVSSDIDPRPLHEVYLRAFRRVVEDAQPWTVMCSYNGVNGEPASQNFFLLTHLLREAWGFLGAVISDWGAVSDRAAAIAAGLDLEMPGGNPESDERIAAALAKGTLDRRLVQASAERLAQLVLRAQSHQQPWAPVDHLEHHALARSVAAHAIVLLKNDDQTLPLDPKVQFAVLGEFAITPRYQGGGSSQVNAVRVDIPLDELRDQLPQANVTYSPGFTTDGSGDTDKLVQRALDVARDAEAVVLFLGLADHQESEGFDRESTALPEQQILLLAEVARVAKKVIVVLSHGGVLDLGPVTKHAHAIVDAALLGQAAGGAIADILSGRINPSGRLAETVPLRLSDTPTYLNFPGERSHVRYGEGLFVGYRWYDARGLDTAFPFGHGLSYTSFEYSDLSLQAAGDAMTVSVTVRNCGNREGREIAQAYVTIPDSAQIRPVRQLVGWAVLDLQAGEARTATIEIDRRDLEYWDVDLNRYLVEPGTYEISVGASSRDLRLVESITLQGEKVRRPLTLNSTLSEVRQDPVAGPRLAQIMPQAPSDGDDASLDDNMARMMAEVPLGRMAAFAGISLKKLEMLVSEANSASEASRR